MSSRDRAVAKALAHRRSGGRARLEALLELDPDAAREALAADDPLRCLFDGGSATLDGALQAALSLRNATSEGMIERLSEAHECCESSLDRAALAICLGAWTLERRTEGEVALVLLPHELRAGTRAWVDLSRSPRRFQLYWALASATEPLHLDDLFHRAWGRPPVDSDDRLALRTTVSRSRRLFPELSIGTVPDGYVLEPSVALYTHPLAPRGGHPLSPVGRELETARLRDALYREGLARLTGPLGSGTSHLARHIAASWPGGSRIEDRRAPEPGRVGDRLLVVDHADGPLPSHRPLLWVGTDDEAVSLGPLPVRDGASLAKALGVAPPDEPTLPVWVAVPPSMLDDLAPLEKRIVALLLGRPEGATASELASWLDHSVLMLTDVLTSLCRRRVTRQHGERFVTEHAFEDVFDPQRPPRSPPTPSPDFVQEVPDPVDTALVAAHRALARARDDRPIALLQLARTAFRAGHPDAGAEEEIASFPMKDMMFRASWFHHLGERSLWRGALFEAEEHFAEAARLHLWSGSGQEGPCWAGRAEAFLRLGLEVRAAGALQRARRLGASVEALEAALAIDRGDLQHARVLLAHAESPASRLRKAQLACCIGGEVSMASAHEGFARWDRRLSGVAWVLDALLTGRPGLLDDAERALVPEDGGTRVALALARAVFDGELDRARTTLRQPFHDSTDTYTWDLIRSVFAPDSWVSRGARETMDPRNETR